MYGSHDEHANHMQVSSTLEKLHKRFAQLISATFINLLT